MNELYKGFIEIYKNRIMYINSDIYYLIIREIIRDLDDFYIVYILDGYYLKNNEVFKYFIKSNKRIIDRFNLGEKLGKFYFKSNIEY